MSACRLPPMLAALLLLLAQGCSCCGWCGCKSLCTPCHNCRQIWEHSPAYRPPGPWFTRVDCCDGNGLCGPNCYNACIDGISTHARARAAAHRGLAAYGRHCNQHPSCHFKDGFVQAHIDLADGGTGVPPAVPPERYWNRRNRSAEGYAKAGEWFEGYQAGVAMAQMAGVGSYNTVATSHGTSGALPASYVDQ